jgi:broad specificity phosphatase PhoE
MRRIEPRRKTGETRLILVRHAHVNTGRMCGWLDVPLSDDGQAQIAAAQRSGLGPRPNALYTSPLLRTRTTAAALAAAWGMEPRVDDGLREIHCGVFEGLGLQQLQREHPELWARNEAQQDSDFAWPGGESYRQFRTRIVGTLSRIAREHAGGTVAIVTHTGLISQAIGVLEGLEPAIWERYRPTPFSATELLWRGKAPTRLVAFSVSEWWRAATRPAE